MRITSVLDSEVIKLNLIVNQGDSWASVPNLPLSTNSLPCHVRRQKKELYLIFLKDSILKSLFLNLTSITKNQDKVKVGQRKGEGNLISRLSRKDLK